VLEIYAEFDSLKVCQVAFRAYSTKIRIIQAKAEKRKSVKAYVRLKRRFYGKIRRFKKVRTVCGSGRVSCAKETRPLPQTVLTSEIKNQ